MDDLSAFDVFLYANDYHNLKAAIKLVYLDMERPEAFFSHGTVEPETMLQAIREQEDSLLPEAMARRRRRRLTCSYTRGTASSAML